MHVSVCRLSLRERVLFRGAKGDKRTAPMLHYAASIGMSDWTDSRLSLRERVLFRGAKGDKRTAPMLHYAASIGMSDWTDSRLSLRERAPFRGAKGDNPPLPFRDLFLDFCRTWELENLGRRL